MNDYLFTEAAEEFQLCLLQSLPKPEECTHVFSPKFERNMKRLITSGVYPRPASAARRIASFVAIFLVIITLLIALSSSAQASISGWIQRQYEKFTQFSFSHSSSEENKDVYFELTDLPDGYIEISRNIKPGNTAAIYANKNTNQILYFYYSKGPRQAEYYFDLENYVQEDVIINNTKGLFYQSIDENTANILQWNSNKTNTFFVIAGVLEKHEMIDLAKKIKISSP